MGREYGKARAGGLVLLGRANGPEGNGTAAKLGEPALKLRLSRIVWEARHVEHLAAFRQEGADIGTGVHRTREHVRMLVGRLRLADESPEDPSQGDGLLHGTARRRRRESLQVEGKVVLDGGARLHGLDLEGRADVGEHGRSKGERLGVVLLPSLVLGPEVERLRVLKIGRKHDGLVTGLPGELDAEVPGVQGNEGKVKVLGDQMLRSKRIEAVDGIPESAGIADMLPREGSEARWRSASAMDQPATTTRPRRRRPRKMLRSPNLRDRRTSRLSGGSLTAERSNGSVDGLHKNTLAMELSTS